MELTQHSTQKGGRRRAHAVIFIVSSKGRCVHHAKTTEMMVPAFNECTHRVVRTSSCDHRGRQLRLGFFPDHQLHQQMQRRRLQSRLVLYRFGSLYHVLKATIRRSPIANRCNNTSLINIFLQMAAPFSLFPT